MKRYSYCFSLLLGAVAAVGVVGCGQETPKTQAPSKSATDSAGQAIADSIKAPMDKARQVENKLEKAVERTSDAVKDAEQ